MPERDLPPDLAGLSLAQIAELAAQQRLPPVASWNPPHCGDSGMRIAANGTWFHEGRPIARPAMVRLFASILRREPDGSHVLVTPVERLSITVDDTPFVAVAMTSEGEGRARRIAFRLDTDFAVVAGPDHPVRIAPGPGGPRPVLLVRDGLEARIARPVYYELAQLALDEGNEPPGLWSDGAFMPLAEAA